MKESPALAALAKRVESATPLGMYRSTEVRPRPSFDFHPASLMQARLLFIRPSFFSATTVSLLSAALPALYMADVLVSEFHSLAFGFYVEKHGEPARGYKTIEWETIPKTVAFHPPWFLLFSWNFIEIRHIHTGKLLQIITGADARCTWDGSGANSDDGPTPGPQGYGAESATMEARIHVYVRQKVSLVAEEGKSADS
jgi:hypothetical protein